MTTQFETESPVKTATTAPLAAPNRTPERATAVVKFHASLNVSDLDRSVAFYTALLGEGPVKHYPDYATFEPDGAQRTRHPAGPRRHLA
jgi:hypothetical protein